MKKLSLIPLFLLILSACQPRDVKVVPDNKRSDRNFNNNGGKKDGGFFLRDEVLAAHLVERQLEAVEALQLLEDHKAFNFEMYKGENGNNFYKRSASFRDFRGSVSFNYDSWEQEAGDKIKLVGVSGHRLLTEEAAYKKKEDGKVDLSKAFFKINEDKILTLTPADSSDQFVVEYFVNVDFRWKGPGAKYWDIHPTMIVMTMKLKKQGNSYSVLESNSTMSVSKEGDVKFNRTLVIKSSPEFVLSPGTCPTAAGTMQLFRFGKDKQTGTMEFSKDHIRETTRDWKEDLIDCSKTRPLFDLSRLLR